MFTHSYRFHLSSSFGAIAILSIGAAFGSLAAQAQSSPFNPNGTASQVGAGAVTAPAYPGGSGAIYGTFNQTFGGNTLTFSDSSVFERVDAPFDVDYPLGTALIETASANNTPTGPLNIAFSQGVGAFGVQVQDYAYDLETFHLQLMDGTTSLGSYDFGPYNNDTGGAAQTAGKSVFVGAQAASGYVITNVVISSTSNSLTSGLETMYSNDFFAGPVTIAAPVPEASTVVSSSMGLFLIAGLLWKSTRRNRAAAK